MRKWTIVAMPLLKDFDQVQARNARELMSRHVTRLGCRVSTDVYRDPDNNIVCESVTLACDGAAQFNWR